MKVEGNSITLTNEHVFIITLKMRFYLKALIKTIHS